MEATNTSRIYQPGDIIGALNRVITDEADDGSFLLCAEPRGIGHVHTVEHVDGEQYITVFFERTETVVTVFAHEIMFLGPATTGTQWHRTEGN